MMWLARQGQGLRSALSIAGHELRLFARLSDGWWASDPGGTLEIVRGIPPATIEEVMYRIARPVSKLLALLPEAHQAPGVQELARNLESSPLTVMLGRKPRGNGFRFLLDEPGGMRPMHVQVRRTPMLIQHVELRHLSEAEADAALASRFCVSVSCVTGENALESLLAQLRVLDALVPDAVAMLDLNCCDAKSGDWMRDTAAASVPPGPTSFFTVHSVSDDGRKGGETWLHTHGLSRMGSIDLDILGIRNDEANDLAILINNVAKLFVEGGVSLPNTHFCVGDGLPLVWLPWEDALQHVCATRGGLGDRDADHRHQRGILLAPARGSPGKLETPRGYVRQLRKDPVLYVPSGETQRMQRLARERLPRFLALQGRFANQEKWAFLVKLGFPTDGNGSAEHLWFAVHSATGETVDGTLINQPYAIARLKKGHRSTFDLQLLTDWAIHSPRGRYSPETVLELERGLPNDPVSAPPLLH